MTGYTVNTGSTTKFSEGWDRIFGGAGSTDRAKRKTAAAKSTASKKSSSKKKQRKAS